PTLASRDLFRAHEKVIKVISGLVDQGFQRVSEAEGEIGKRSANLVRDSLTLLGTSLGLALIGSLFTVRVTRELFRSMTWQQGELMRVSWHMLADHESIARRFSHELHDELGQALAALKSNLAALSHQPTNVNRINDSAR